MRRPKPKVVNAKPGTMRTRGPHGITITVKPHATKRSAMSHARRQIKKGKVSVVGKRTPYVTFTGNVKPKKAKTRRKRRR